MLLCVVVVEKVTLLPASGASRSSTLVAKAKRRVHTLPTRTAGPSGAPMGWNHSGYHDALSGAAHVDGAASHGIAPWTSPLYHAWYCMKTLASATVRKAASANGARSRRAARQPALVVGVVVVDRFPAQDGKPSAVNGPFA